MDFRGVPDRRREPHPNRDVWLGNIEPRDVGTLRRGAIDTLGVAVPLRRRRRVIRSWDGSPSVVFEVPALSHPAARLLQRYLVQ